MGEQAFPEAHKPTLSYRCKCLKSTSTFCLTAGTQDELSTCILGRCFGLFPTFILRKPTAIAPEETMTTRCPSLMRATAVSTMRERMDNRGSCVFSWTIELDPIRKASQQVLLYIPIYLVPCIPSLITMVRCFWPFMLTCWEVSLSSPSLCMSRQE